VGTSAALLRAQASPRLEIGLEVGLALAAATALWQSVRGAQEHR
jgi:hypothetical protein